MYKQSQSGFSLVETLVSITILLIVIVGPMTIMSTASNSASFSSDQVIAFFLAQEGTELAQKARDDLVLERFAGGNPNPWDYFRNESGTYGACFTSGCGLELDNFGDLTSITNCSGSSCDLYFDDNADVRSRYTHSSVVGNLETPFSRTIRFQNINAYEVRVVSEVEWFSGQTRNAQSVSVETVLVDVYAP